jgi:hypothetical protein
MLTMLSLLALSNDEAPTMTAWRTLLASLL